MEPRCIIFHRFVKREMRRHRLSLHDLLQGIIPRDRLVVAWWLAFPNDAISLKVIVGLLFRLGYTCEPRLVEESDGWVFAWNVEPMSISLAA